MQKSTNWVIELFCITIIFGIINLLVLTIGFDNYDNILSCHILNFIRDISFFIYIISRLAFTQTDDDKLQSILKIKFQIWDFFIIGLLIFISPLTYGLLLKSESVRIFNFIRHVHVSSFNQIHSWLIFSLISLYTAIIVIAEELYFRFYLFKIQINWFGKYTWLINGFSWSIYHLFTPTNFVAILPTCLLFSYVYQKRRNIWITIIAHLINNFIAIYPTAKSYL